MEIIKSTQYVKTNIKIINKECEDQIYAILISLFNYKKNIFNEFQIKHIKLISDILNISEKTLIELMLTFDWCLIKKKHVFFNTKYYLYIYL